MAVFAWTDASLLVGDQELRDYAKSFQVSTDVTALDTTSFASSGWVEQIGGLKTTTINLELMSDYTEAGQDAKAWSYLGTADVAHTVAAGSADGSAAYLFQGIPLSYTQLQGNVGDLAQSSLSGSTSTAPAARGKLIHPTTTARTSSSTGTGQQQGALSAIQSMYAALHVVAASGTSPTLDVIVQSDDNAGFTTPTTRITFTQATGLTYEFSSVAGAITDDYWRISYTIGGSTPSFNFGVAIGIA